MQHIKEYDPWFFKSFVDLVDSCFWIQNIDKAWLIQWKFFQTPNKNNNKTICSYSNNQIVWQYSNIAIEFLYQKKSIDGYLCQDMCILPAFRWQWLISQMSTILYKTITKPSFSIWFSNEYWVKVDKNSKWYWYNVIDNLTSYTLPTIFIAQKTYHFRQIYQISELQNINFTQFDAFSNYIQTNNTFEYMKWRYFDKPNGNYNFFWIYNNKNKIIWYVVLKFKKWVATIHDMNYTTTTNQVKLIYTLKKIWLYNKMALMTIQVLNNAFWEKFFSSFLNKKRQSKIYFTLKNHNNFEEFDILNKEKRIIQTWDIL